MLMELPQSRPFDAEGRKKPTHDFLSACSNSTVHSDPMPSSQGEYLKTQDFLQPLERVGARACTKEEGIIRSSVDTTAASSELKSQHVLPGGIGTYTISHIPSNLYHHHNQQVPKSEVSPMFTVSQASSNERNAADENSISHCSSNYAASGFTLWDESLGKKRHTRVENARERTNIIVDAAAPVGQWQGMEQRGSFSSHSSLQTSGLKSRSQSFMDMIRSAKGSSQDDDLDDDDEEFIMKKENNTPTSQCQREDLRVKVDGKGHGNEQKPNTPRSKHSATEQRRRSKINDRFQMLRQLIPNSDQKRDKASFLLEVIEYINFLQEKVNKHEVIPYQGKLMNWRDHQQPPEGAVPVLADVDMDQQCLNRAIETITLSNRIFSTESSQLCPVSSDAAMESEKLREEEDKEELSVHKGTISISSVYSQGLLKTLTETLQTSGVDLSKASISVQIKLSKQPQKDEDVHRRVRPRSQTGDENHDDDDNHIVKQPRKQKKLKKENSVRNI
ncbi:unnamed protein product [Microthlaspi erraticum]|uniref:BHLH domain-containing protein n=1 Tax=Microthlaspi erraticum TaxID=1685480 RepID=A0A6D2I9C7_9BRAS|nr:unnamed protein product [Microthlaspi erraticum]